MASLRYHAGRMVLYPRGSKWAVRIKTRTTRLDLPLESGDLRAAVLEAEGLYSSAQVLGNGRQQATTYPKCSACIHWEAVHAACGLGFPEGRSSGGRHAKHCAAFWESTS